MFKCWLARPSRTRSTTAKHRHSLHTRTAMPSCGDWPDRRKCANASGMLPALRQACGPAESGCRVVFQRIVHGLREDTCCAILVLEGSNGGDQKDSVGSTSNLDLTKTQHHLSPTNRATSMSNWVSTSFRPFDVTSPLPFCDVSACTTLRADDWWVDPDVWSNDFDSLVERSDDESFTTTMT